jgi:PhoPQ-activated pathogenicity-related protein
MWKRFVPAAAMAAIGLVAAFGEAPRAGRETALDQYVNRPDPAYHWEVAKTISGSGYQAVVIDLSSQSWRKTVEVDRNLWKHWLTVIKPEKVTSSTAFLFITGGNNGDPAPEKANPILADMAVASGSVTAELRMVPNQPLAFPDDGNKPLVEDQFISYTWDKFLHGGDDEWLARLPMTKSAVRAMDTVTAFCAGAGNCGASVDKFVVAGGSKRGWTTWTTAAVDKRVIAIEPLVIDLLNVEASFDHHWRVYGFWAPAIKEYQDRGIMDWQGTKRYRELMTIVEPFSYRDRLTMPKYMINSAGDQFFLPDSSQFYFDELKGEKYLRYIPNTDHSLKDSDVGESMIAFHESVVKGTPRPRFSWKRDKDGSVRVSTTDKPTQVRLWQATNPDKRDFRLETIGNAYSATELKDDGAGVYVAKPAGPPKGFTAYFVELTFPSGGKYPFKFTTQVWVTPDILPFPKYVPKRPATQAVTSASRNP